MTDKRRKKTSIIAAFVETKVISTNGRIETSIFDGYKHERDKDPVYVTDLRPYMARRLAERAFEGLKIARDKIDKENRDAISGVVDEAN
jgi:hypothetical protein